MTAARYCLVERSRLPVGITAVTHPVRWTISILTLWREHILRGQDETLNESQVFQFLQVRPGQYDKRLRRSIHPDAGRIYPPESLAYALQLRQIVQHQPPPPIDDTLPPIYPNDTYAALTSSQVASLRASATLQESLGEGGQWCDLAGFICEYEAFGPHHVRPAVCVSGTFA